MEFNRILPMVALNQLNELISFLMVFLYKYLSFLVESLFQQQTLIKSFSQHFALLKLQF